MSAMKITMAIPTYWGRKKQEGYQKGDIFYDHPTPIDEEGTLERCLESIKILKSQDFNLVIIAAATTEKIKEEVEKKVKNIVKKANLNLPSFVFSYSQLRKIYNFFKEQKRSEFNKLLKLQGYSNIRNLCIFLPHILNSEIAILIDDDEVFEDKNYIQKAQEFIGQEFCGETITAVAGYYLNPEGNYLVKQEEKPYMAYWNKIGYMNSAFKIFIGKAPRIKKTPFVFGGNMVIHQNLFSKVPFDPNVPRGEDIDYLINAKMFGFNFYLDGELSIKHLPPSKPHPDWKRLREDIIRFIYEREKLRGQFKKSNMNYVSVSELDPYPGELLKDNLFELIFKANLILALEYLIKEEKDKALQALQNIYLANLSVLPKFNPFKNLISLQKKWQEMMKFVKDKKLLRNLRS